ncbi:UBP1-associated protein 2C [Nicotiana tabacum]|uniref:UBP1-associated protein 2C n=2 Tax=Nicotiana TaxID=4085 RepID=A0A1S4CHF2_TOBAC|nr:PREDICTED: UBP1-associated protein 2C-like [Nicotiana sylvestris]XP_016500632.1 PREDICTED: UBP1-associated protein 2C-like [Nicotiana tabacum]
MEELKKRKLDEMANNGQSDSNSTSSLSVEELRSLLDHFAKPQLVDLLAKLGSQYPSIAEEIKSVASAEQSNNKDSVASADPALRKLFVRGLAWNTTSETLCAAFTEHGEIEEGAVITDKVTGVSRGYGFITYKDVESAQMALKAPSKMIDGRMAVCNLACEGLSSTTVTADQAQRKLYIGGLSSDTTSEMLLSFFSRHGEIEEGSVAYNKDTKTSRGFGFVTYKTVEGAKKALNDPQRILGGRNLTVKLADNHKGKVTQSQVRATMVPMSMPLAPGYPQAQKTHSGPAAPVGYGYPQAMAAYTNSTYSSQPAAYTNSTYSSQPGAAPPYSGQAQFPYPQYPVKQEPQTTPASFGGYPYYMGKQ